MSLSEIGSIASIGSFVLAAILAIVQNWAKIIKGDGPMLSKIILILVIIGILGAGLSVYGVYKSRQKLLPQVSMEWKDMQKISVVGKTFVNEKILLDGHSYNNCTFINPRLVYNGTAPFDITNSTFKGQLLIESEKPQIEAMLYALKELNFMRPDLKVYGPHTK